MRRREGEREHDKEVRTQKYGEIEGVREKRENEEKKDRCKKREKQREGESEKQEQRDGKEEEEEEEEAGCGHTRNQKREKQIENCERQFTSFFENRRDFKSKEIS